MTVTFPAPHAGPSPLARAILKSYTERPLGGISFRRLNADAACITLIHKTRRRGRGRPTRHRLKLLHVFARPAWLRPARDAPAGMTGRMPARMAGTPLVISRPGLPCRLSCFAARLCPEVQTLKDSGAGRAAGLGQDGRSGSRRTRPAVPSACAQPLPAQRSRPAEPAAQGQRRQGHGRPPLFLLWTSRPSLALALALRSVLALAHDRDHRLALVAWPAVRPKGRTERVELDAVGSLRSASPDRCQHRSQHRRKAHRLFRCA